MKPFFIFVIFATLVCRSEVYGQEAGLPSPTPTQDPISPLIVFLQQLQGLRELFRGVGGGGFGGGGRNVGGGNLLLQRPTTNSGVDAPLASNSIDGGGGDPPATDVNVNVNQNRGRPRLTDFLQTGRVASFFDRIFRNNNNGRSDRIGNRFAESLLNLIFSRRMSSLTSNGNGGGGSANGGSAGLL